MNISVLYHLARFAAVIVMAVAGLAAPALAGSIEANPDKKYVLNKAHGPVMIMVETFRKSRNEDVDPEARKAEDVANELVLELRTLGLPAYVYKMGADDGVIETVGRAGERERMKNLHKVESFGVIAGNYRSMSDPLARKSLEYVKKLRPECLNEKSGIVWYAPPGQGPFQKAFLTVNPMLSAAEAEQRMAIDTRLDPLVLSLNSQVNYSLLENKGKYTLQVAMFTGRKVVENSQAAQKVNFFEQGKKNPLDIAAEDANDLAIALRQHRGQEAYCWHDQFTSIVTVGSYASPQDPKIQKDMELFRAKPKRDEKTGVVKEEAEVMWIDGTGEKGNVTRLWVFMPKPILIPVPKAQKSGPLARSRN